jgi:hypothetical protein
VNIKVLQSFKFHMPPIRAYKIKRICLVQTPRRIERAIRRAVACSWQAIGRKRGEYTCPEQAHISVIRVKRATRKNSQLAPARRVAMKMGRRPRCSSVTYGFRYAPSSRLAGGPF